MIRDDNSLYLLYIEPKKEERLKYPIDDILTYAMEIAVKEGIKGIGNYDRIECNGRFYPYSGYMGFHTTDCGEWSDSQDILLCSGHITNSLAPFYLRWYRNSIKVNDMIKVGNVLYWLHIHMYYNRLPYSREEIDIKINELNKLRGNGKFPDEI
jgi:hypothetical protein